MKHKNVITRALRAFTLMSEGTIAVAFGLLAPVLIGSVGVAMDLSQAYLVRQRLHGALDASALSAAAVVEEDDAEVEQRVKDFLQMNYPPEKIGFIRMDEVEVEVSESEVTVFAQAHFPTTFMSILGIEQISVSSSTVVAREIKGLEVVLVLDNTGSLGASNMESVRTAAKNFVNILFERVAEPDDIKIGIVPYSASVRVGRYGLGQFPDGTAGYGTPFVTLPTGVNYTTDHASTDWYGCVVEHEATNYNAAATHVANSRGQLWTTNGSGVCSSSSDCRGHGWGPGSGSNDPYPDDTQDNYAGPWDIYVYGRVINSGQECDDFSSYSNSRCSSCTGTGGDCNKTYCYCWRSQPNTSCPFANIMPLTSDQQDILDLLDTMSYEGSTYSNIGMAWGMRVLSPDEPFIEGSEWEDEEWNKAIVLMTDGEMSPSSVYSGYWDSNKSSFDSVANLNTRMQEVCTWLKAAPRNVIIYTITFDHATSDISAATKTIYRNCATDADHYFDAPSQAELISTFERISGALANLHVRR
jgi:Flp pilus assembly protein TadG